MFKFIKSLYTISKNASLADIALSIFLWLVTLTLIPETIVSCLRLVKFTHHQTVLLGVIIFEIFFGIVAVGIEHVLLKDYDKKRGFFDKNNWK